MKFYLYHYRGHWICEFYYSCNGSCGYEYDFLLFMLVRIFELASVRSLLSWLKNLYQERG